MKKFFLCLALVVFLVCFCVCFGVKDKNIYLRIKVTANSFSAEDKDIKYEIKDKVVEFLTPYIKECESFEEVHKTINKNIETILCIINGVLVQNNLDYKCSANIDNQFFPTRHYDNITIESGFYDALSISLGDGAGDSWWCVLYPPLCFSDAEFGDIDYKSRFINLCVIKEN